MVCNQGSGGGSRQCASTPRMQLDQMSDSRPCSCMSFVGMEEVLLGHGGLFGLGGRWRSILVEQHSYGKGRDAWWVEVRRHKCVAFK
jgi:hypothetical protein